MSRRSTRNALGLACAFVLATAASARAVDELIPGHSHQVQSGTIVKMLAKSKGDFDLPAGDPRQEGGQLEITDTGGGSSMTVALPASGWKRIGSPHDPKGFKYKGAGTPSDPCMLVMVTTRQIKFVCLGEGVTLDTPFAGTSAIVLTVNGTRYCAEFGGVTVRNDDHQLRRRLAPAPAACGGGGGGTTSTSSTTSTLAEETTTSTSSTSSTTVATPTTSSTTSPTPTTSTSSTSSTTVATPTTSSTTAPTPTTSTSSTSSTTVATPTTSSTTAPTPTTSTSSTTSTTAPAPTTSSSSTSTSSTTSTTAALCCNGAGALRFTNANLPGDCGDILNATGVLVTNVACSGLYTGGGGNSVPLPYAVPDLATSITSITSCAGQTATLGGTTSAQTGSNRTCTTAGCLFGGPLAVPNPGSTPTSVCVLNSVGGPPSGTATCNTGATSLVLPLSSVLYLTGDTATDPSSTIGGIQPCPLCSGTTCIGGPNNGLSCTPHTSALNAAYPTSHDCPPDPMFNIGTLPVNFSLSSGTVTWSGTTATNDTGGTFSVQNRVFSGFCRDADGTGAFAGTTPATAQQCWENGMAVGAPCAGTFESCEQRNNGAFGPAGGANRTIRAVGSGASVLGGPAPATLVSVFSIAPTFDATVDAAGDLPGPGAVALPGTASLCATPNPCP